MISVYFSTSMIVGSISFSCPCSHVLHFMINIIKLFDYKMTTSNNTVPTLLR